MRAAYTFVVAALFLSSLCAGYTDFVGMSAPHKREVLSDGTIRLTHDVHHTFEKHGTYFKASYEALHEDKWHIVDLSKEVTGFSSNFRCSSKGESELYIRNPTSDLISLLRKQDLKHTVVTAHPRHHCRGKVIFRHVLELVEEEDRLVLKTTRANYNDVFRDLTMNVTTNHVFAKKSSANRAPALAARTSARGQSAARGYRTQNWWHKLTGAVSHAIHQVAQAVEHAAVEVADVVEHAVETVVHDVDTVVELVAGDYDNDIVHNFPGVYFNLKGQVDVSFNEGLADIDATGSCSFGLNPTLNFALDIKTWKLQNLEVYFEGASTAAVAVTFDIKAQKEVSKTIQVADIQLDTITFTIGPVPFVIEPSVPISAGVKLSLGGEVDVGATVTASAVVKYGVSYTPGSGFAPIREASFQWQKDFSPKKYKADVGLVVFIQPSLAVVIDGIFHAGISAAIYGDVLMQSNNQCIFDVQINAKPIVSVTAAIGISFDGHDVFEVKFTPMTVWSQTFPIYSYCDPVQSGQSTSSGRSFALQSADGSVNWNPPAFTETTFTELTDGNIGKLWSGRSVSCGFVDMQYSVQFALGEQENTSLAILYISQSRIPSHRRHHRHGMVAATGVITYIAMGMPSVSGSLNYTVINASNAYVATSNPTELPMNIPTTLTLTFSPTDIRFVSMSSDLVCGTVSLEAPAVYNDNSTLTGFQCLQQTASAASNSTLASTTDSSSSTSSIGLIVYAAVATCMTIIATGSAIHFHSKSRAAPSTSSRKMLTEDNNLGAHINVNSDDVALTERNEQA